jgi:hypothetical protein
MATSEQDKLIQSLAGTWTLEKNENFEAFLIHVQYGWATRKVALMASVETTITPTAAGCRKVVKSSFYETDEMVFPDGQQRTDKDGKKITCYIKDGALVTDIIGTVANWTETVQADDKNKKVVIYTWKDANSGEPATCTQHFLRKSESSA